MDNMIAFTRGKDLARYAGTLTSVIEALVQDMAKMARLAGYSISEDEIIDAYLIAAEGPTIFEQVLINQGRLTEAEAAVNHVADMIYRSMAAKINEHTTPRKLKYFEVAFSNGSADDCDAVWVCIRGTEQPTVAEAQQFMAYDSTLFKAPVVGVYAIDEQTARSCYNFDNEANWPIFSKGGGCSMAQRKSKGDVQWRIPGRKTPIAYSTKATSDLIGALAEQGGTIREVQSRVNFDQEAKAVLQAYIDRGYGDLEARQWFKY